MLISVFFVGLLQACLLIACYGNGSYAAMLLDDSTTVKFDLTDQDIEFSNMVMLPNQESALVSAQQCSIEFADFAADADVRTQTITEFSDCSLSNYDNITSIGEARFRSIDNIIDLKPGTGRYAVLDATAMNVRILDWCASTVSPLACE